MNAAERLMALKALQVGVNAAVEEATREVDALREATSSKSFDTRFGTLVLTAPKPTIQFAVVDLHRWVKDNLPHEYIPAHTETVTVEHPASIHPTAEATLRKRCSIAKDGSVVDTETGELIEFASVTQRSPYWTGRLSDETKQEAVETVLSRVDAVTGLMVVES
jgi:hypothetical protein